MEVEKIFKTCRLCLGGNDPLIHVFEKGSFGYAPADVMAELLRFEVSAGDIYPQYVCGVCLGKLKEFKEFKEQCDACKLLLDRAYAAKSQFYEDIKPNGVDPHVSPQCTTTRDDSQIPNEHQMILCQEEETEPLDDPVDIKPNVSELNYAIYGHCDDPLSVVKAELHEEGSNDETEVDNNPTCVDSFNVRYISQSEHSLQINKSVPEDGPRNKYGCNECLRMFPDLSHLSIHVRSHEGLVSFPCPICTVGFSEKCNLHEHMKSQHSDCKEAEYHCVDCGLQHFNTTKPAPEKERRFPSRKGSEVVKHFEDSRDASDTNDEGVEVKRKIYWCSVCGKKYLCRRAYHRHVDMHKFGKTLKCSRCDKYFAHKYMLSTHMKSHSDEKVNCKNCGRYFKNERLLKLHCLTMHEVRNFKCDICGKEFATNGHLNEHKKSHDKGGNYICGICRKIFQSTKAFKRHEYYHRTGPGTQKKHACNVCEFKCYTPSQLVIHTRTHTKEKPFPCPTCGVRLSTKHSLETHVNSTHSESGGIKVQCDECGQSYSTIQNLERHKRNSHMGLKEFKCEHCGQEFTQKHNLTNHVLKNHSHSATDN